MCKTCGTCLHFGCQGHEGYGRCNKLVHVKGVDMLYEFAWFKAKHLPCEDHWDYRDGTLWRDSFGYIYTYSWLRNRFECEQTGQVLSIEHKDRLRKLQ